MGDPRHRHRGGAWHHRRALPDEPRRRGRLPARRLRRHRAPRRGPGAGRQGVRQPGDRRSAEDDHLRRAARADGVRGPAVDVVGRPPRTRPPAPSRAPRRRRAADGRGDRRRRDHPRVHVGHHGAAEGGDAHQRQLRVRRRVPRAAPRSAARRQATRTRRHGRDLPPALPRRRAGLLDLAPGRRCGVVLNFAESIETVTANLREVQPTLFFAVPRIWEKLHAGVLIKGHDASRSKRFVLDRGLRAAAKIGRAKVANGGNHTIGSRVRYAVWYPLVFRPLQGAHRPAPLPPRLVRGGADRPRGAGVLHGHRHPRVRALRDDREHRHRHAEPARPGQGRHGRRAVPGHRAAPRPR